MRLALVRALPILKGSDLRAAASILKSINIALKAILHKDSV